MRITVKVLTPLVAAFAVLTVTGCGGSKPSMPVTPMPGGSTPGAGPQTPPAGAVATPASAPSVKPR